MKPWMAAAAALAALALAPAAHAAPAWTCGAGSGWIGGGTTRTNAPGVGGEPCPVASGAATGASAPGGSLSVSGSLAVDGGAPLQTTDTRKPAATATAKSLTIQTADGNLVVTAQNLRDEAHAACDANRTPQFTSASSPGDVTVNGRPIDTGSEYSEPGVGVNGAPLLGKITIKFGEVVRTDNQLLRRALHVIVTDRYGAIVFEGVGGEVAVGRDGAVCDPPPVCPPGTQPQEGKCVKVEVAPLPSPPSAVAPAPAPGQPGSPAPNSAPKPKPNRRGCANADARVLQVSNRRLAAATLCLMNVERKKRHLRGLRMSRDLTLAASRHARSMIAGHYFAHDEPAGPSFLDRVLRSGYLERFGTWRIGENLGWGWGSGGTPRALVAAWMRSRPHRRNILNRRFHDVGIAVRSGAPRRRSRPKPVTYVIDFGGFLIQARRA